MDIKIGAVIEIRQFRKGQQIRKITQKCKSFSKYFDRFIFDLLISNGAGDATLDGLTCTILPLTNLAGVEKTPAFTSTTRYFNAIKDVKIGESDASWSYTQYDLVSPKMSASSGSLKQDTTESGNTIYLELQGIFDITETFAIRETALVGSISDTEANLQSYLVSRDVLETPLSVENTDTVSIVYRLTVGE